MQKNEKVRASNRVSLQRFVEESNEKQKLAKNLKTAGSNPLGVELRLLTQPRSASQPSPPPSAGICGLCRFLSRDVWEAFWERFTARLRFASNPRPSVALTRLPSTSLGRFGESFALRMHLGPPRDANLLYSYIPPSSPLTLPVLL